MKVLRGRLFCSSTVWLISAAMRAIALLLSRKSEPDARGLSLSFSVIGGALNLLLLACVSNSFCCCSSSAMRRALAWTLSPSSTLRMSGTGDLLRPLSAWPPPSRLACASASAFSGLAACLALTRITSRPGSAATADWGAGATKCIASKAPCASRDAATAMIRNRFSRKDFTRNPALISLHHSNGAILRQTGTGIALCAPAPRFLFHLGFAGHLIAGQFRYFRRGFSSAIACFIPFFCLFFILRFGIGSTFRHGGDFQQARFDRQVHFIPAQQVQFHLCATRHGWHARQLDDQRNIDQAQDLVLAHHGVHLARFFLGQPAQAPVALHIRLEIAIGRISGIKRRDDGEQIRIARLERGYQRRRHAMFGAGQDLPLVDQVGIAAQRRGAPRILIHAQALMGCRMGDHAHLHLCRPAITTTTTLAAVNARYAMVVQHLAPGAVGKDHQFSNDLVQRCATFAAG